MWARLLAICLGEKVPERYSRMGLAIPMPRGKTLDRPRGSIERRHHVSQLVLQRGVKAAIRQAGIAKAASCHTFRHSCATYLLETDYDIRTVQELFGHRDVNTTMIHTHVLNRGGRGDRSPVDLL